MVLEYILKEDLAERRPLFAMIAGFIFTFIGAGTAFIFFGKNVSIAMLFLATLLIVPLLIKLFDVEEERERKEGLKHFFHNHGDVFEACLFLFVGVFIGYLVLGMMVNVLGVDFNSAFDYQLDVLESQQGLSKDVIENFMNMDFNPGFGQFLGIATANLGTALIFFILSFFYGAGAIFLIVLNASIFSTFISYIANNLAKSFIQMLPLLGAFFVYSIPEVSGFLLAAIAGAVVSKAVIQEKLGSDHFRNVFKDATILLVISFIIIIIAALLEVYVGARLFYSFL